MRAPGLGSSGSRALAGSNSSGRMGFSVYGVKSGVSVKQSDNSDAVASNRFSSAGKLALVFDT